MYLKNIKIKNYKNISETNIFLINKITCLVGNNGVGKTNFLDAVYYLTYSRSYFNHIDNQNINYHESFFRIEGNFQKHDNKYNVGLSFSKDKGKTITIDQKKHKKISEHFGLFPVVMITPNDTNLINEGSEIRRNFIDAIISQYDKEYLNLLIKHKKALLQRNKQLKNFSSNNFFDKDLLDIWDYQIIEISPIICSKRKEFMDNFIGYFKKYYKNISKTDEIPDIIYKSELLEKNIAQVLSDNLQKDLILQRTSGGIHKDDFLFKLNNFNLKKNASQGQQKSFVTALKFAHSSFIHNKTTIKPILLLDDIFDKLDNSRVMSVVELVSGDKFGQILITHTDKEKLEQILQHSDTNYSIIEIKNDFFKQSKNM